MVFTSLGLMARIAKNTDAFFGKTTTNPDVFWKRRAVKMMTSHFYGRARNCYRISNRYHIRQLTYNRVNRKVRKQDAQDLWDCRVEGVCNELNYNSWFLRESLTRTGIALDRKVLANFALNEPRTFRAITAIAANKTSQSGEEGGLEEPKAGPGPEIDIVGKL